MDQTLNTTWIASGTDDSPAPEVVHGAASKQHRENHKLENACAARSAAPSWTST
jgi:hypothetical protein